MSDWVTLRQIVEEATDLPAAERDTYLDAACANDADMRREAADLIASSLRDELYLEPPDLGFDDPVLAAQTRVGAYELLRPLGSGGMGTVYEAQRRDPNRRVALKVMRGGLASPASAARFRYEVEVLAALEHPHIARMYDTGIHVEASNGRRELPWFAMEYVESAQPIVRYVRDQDLSLEQRVDLFASVCDAVHYGHQKGVLHRDLKPDNILVDAHGAPKVIDFGVARATDADLTQATQRTRLGEIVGTLAYMSPEQIAGDRAALDVRSDVYALGVVLYELLAGALPHDLSDANLVEAARRIQQATPRRPSTVDPRIRGDLETIVLKCLSKEPDRRYASAAALAQDLRRYVAREPVEAHPPSLAYQVRMFARRNRLLVTSVALVVGVSIAAAVVSLVSLDRVQRSEQAARAETKKTRELFGTLLDRSVKTTRKFAPRLKQLSGGAKVTLEMAQAELEDLATLEKLAPADPEVRKQIAIAYLRLGEVQGDPTAVNQLGDREGCARSYERALAIARALLEERPDDPRITYLAADAMTRLGKLASFDRKAERASALLGEALGLATSLAERHPDHSAYLGGVVVTLGRLAEHQGRSGDTEACKSTRLQQLARAKELYDRWPEKPVHAERLAAIHNGLGSLHLFAGEDAKARDAHQAAADLYEPLVSQSPENIAYRSALGFSLLHAGMCNRRLGQLDDAAPQAQRAVQIYAVLRTEDPENRHVPLMLGMAHGQIGAIAMNRAQDEATETAERRAALEIARDAFHEAWQVYAAMEKAGDSARGHGGFAERMRQRHEKAQEMLGEAD